MCRVLEGLVGGRRQGRPQLTPCWACLPLCVPWVVMVGWIRSWPGWQPGFVSWQKEQSTAPWARVSTSPSTSVQYQPTSLLLVPD